MCQKIRTLLQISPIMPISKLRLKKTISMPSQVESVQDVQAVVVGGKVYIGGVSGGYSTPKPILLEYTVENDCWKQIKTPTTSFGMAVVNNQLIITGGGNYSDLTDQVWVLDRVTYNWTQPYPAMPTAKASPAVGYKRWVLVVEGESRCVEVLDTLSKQWFVATPLLSKVSTPSLTVIQDTLYIIGESSAFSAFIPTLIADAMIGVTTPTMWQQLPAPRIGSTTVVLPGTSEVMMIGGQGHCKTVDICYAKGI